MGYWFTAIGLRVEDLAVLQDGTNSLSFIAATAPDSDHSWLGVVIKSFISCRAPLAGGQESRLACVLGNARCAFIIRSPEFFL